MTNIFATIKNFFNRETQGENNMRVSIRETDTGRFGLFDACGCLATDTTYSRARDARRGAIRHGFNMTA